MATRNVEYIISLRDRFGRGIDKLNAKAFQLNNRMNRLNKTTIGLRGAFLALGGAVVLRNIVETTAKFEGLDNAITFASGSAFEARNNLKFLDDIAKQLGLDITATKEGFQTLSGAFVGTGVEAKEQRKIFGQVATAVSALNLSGEDAKGVFLALGQIMSKGVVSAEELRRQLGNRIPGAFGIGARAIGVTVAELDKMLKKGELLSTDFLPKFADELEKTFVGALPVSTKSLRANLNRLGNVFVELKRVAGDEFTPAISKLTTLIPIISSNIGLLIKVAKTAITAFVTFKVATFALITINKIYVISVKIMTVANRLFTQGMTKARKSAILLGVAIKTNPIGILATILATAAAAFITFGDDINNATEKLTKFGNKIDEIDAKIGRKLFQKLARGLVDPLTKTFTPKGLETLIKAIPNLAKSELESLSLFLVEQQELLNRSITNAETVLQKTIFTDELNKILGALEIVNREFSKFKKVGGAGGGIGGITTQQIGITKITSAAPKIFNINIDSLIENVTISSTTLPQGLANLKKQLEEAMLTMLSDVQIQVR